MRRGKSGPCGWRSANTDFRPLVLRKLEAAGIDWELAVGSDDDRAVEALTSADLAVGAYLEESIPPHLEAITPGAALPDLGVQKVNLYTRSGRDELLEELANMLRKGYGAVRPVTSVNAA